MKKKILSLLTAFAMVFGIIAAPFTTARAEEATTTKKVTVHKILTSKSNLAFQGKKVTITTGKGDDAKSESKVIVVKDGQYYEASNLETPLANTTDFVKALKKEDLDEGKSALIEDVKFEGQIGIDGTNYDGNKIEKLVEFFGAGTQDIGGVYFAWAKKDTDGAYYWINAQGEFIEPKAKVDETKLAELPDGTMTGTTVADKGAEFTTENFKGEYKIYEIHEKSKYTGEVYFDKDGNELVKKVEDGQTKYYNGEKVVEEKDVIKKGTTLTDMKAVPVVLTLPLVNDGGIVEEAHVYPKNTEEAPKIDKNFKYEENDKPHVVGKSEGYTDAAEGAGPTDGAKYENYRKDKATVTTEVGKKIPFEVKTKIPANAKYNKLVWDDQMQKGLVFNKDLTIAGVDGLTEGTDYTLYQTDRGFRLVFKEAGLTKVENAANNGEVEITLTYSAHLDGTVKPDEVKENNVTFDYSNKPGDENDTPEVKPADKKITVEKTWAADGKEITEADRHVKALFTLQVKEGEKWVDVETYESTYKEDFTHEFTGLDDNKTYRVVESVSGYEPEYTSTENGKLVIVNKIDNDNPNTLKPSNPKVVDGGKKFVKTNQDGTERLAGAEFYVKNKDDQYLVADKKPLEAGKEDPVAKAKANLDKLVSEYNAMTKEEQDGQTGKDKKAAIDKAQEAYNKAFVENASAYSWTTLKEYNDKLKEADPNAKEITDVKDIKNIVVLTSDGQGRFEITGLEYGEYKLEEKTAPEGYAKRSDKPAFTVAKGSYLGNKNTEFKYTETDTDDGETVAKDGYGLQVKNKKVSIPQTGGIGSLIFIVAGLAIMGGAFVAYKKSQATA